MRRPTSKRGMRLDRWFHERVETLTGKVALLITVVLVLVFGAGAIVHFGLDHFASFWTASWWAFLHLMEPAALREDDATDVRVVGVFLVLAGLIVLAGILFEILTQVVDASLERLSESDVPVETRGHLLVVGWSDDLPETLTSLIGIAPKVKTDLKRLFSTIVVLVPTAARPQRATMHADVRRAVRHVWRDPQIVYGDPDRPDTYDLVSAGDARAIVITFTLLSGQAPDPMMADAANVRTALAIARYLGLDRDAPPAGSGPYVGVTLFWGEHADAAMSVLPASFDGLIVDRMITSQLAIELTHPIWSEAIHRLLTQETGARVQLVRDASLAGVAFADLPAHFAAAVPVGLMGPDRQARITPPPDTAAGAEDTVIVLAEGDASPRTAASMTTDLTVPAFDFTASTAPIQRTLLIVGFNHRIAALLAELADLPFAQFRVLSLSHISPAERRREVPQTVASRLTLEYIDGVPTDTDTLRAAIDTCKPDAIIVSGDWYIGGMERMEAEILFSFLALKHLVGAATPLVVMPYSGDYASVFVRGVNDRGVLSANRLAGLGLAWTLLQPDVVPVFGALFGTHRTRLTSLPLPPGAPVPFSTLACQMARHGAVLAGIVRSDGSPWLAPAGDTVIPPGTELLVIMATSQTPPMEEATPAPDREIALGTAASTRAVSTARA